VKIFTVNKNIISTGIFMDMSPFPKIVVGKFNKEKKPIWIPVRPNDLELITKNIGECRNRNRQVLSNIKEEDQVKTCRVCGVELNKDGTHPDDGFAKKLIEGDIVQLKEKDGKYKGHLIVKSKENNNYSKVLVLWKLPYSCDFVSEKAEIISKSETINSIIELLVCLSQDGFIEAVDTKPIGRISYKGDNKLDISFQR
jgi:hypothetical protein